MPDRLADLARQIVHVGGEPRAEQDRGIDFARLRVIRRAVEKVGQIAQKLAEDVDR